MYQPKSPLVGGLTQVPITERPSSLSAPVKIWVPWTPVMVFPSRLMTRVARNNRPPSSPKKAVHWPVQSNGVIISSEDVLVGRGSGTDVFVGVDVTAGSITVVVVEVGVTWSAGVFAVVSVETWVGDISVSAVSGVGEGVFVGILAIGLACGLRSLSVSSMAACSVFRIAILCLLCSSESLREKKINPARMSRTKRKINNIDGLIFMKPALKFCDAVERH